MFNENKNDVKTIKNMAMNLAISLIFLKKKLNDLNINTVNQQITLIIFPKVICNGPNCWLTGKNIHKRANVKTFAIAKKDSDKLIGSNVDQ